MQFECLGRHLRVSPFVFAETANSAMDCLADNGKPLIFVHTKRESPQNSLIKENSMKELATTKSVKHRKRKAFLFGIC